MNFYFKFHIFYALSKRILPIHRLVMVFIVSQAIFTHLSLVMDFAFLNEMSIFRGTNFDPFLRLLLLQIIFLANETDCESIRPIIFVLVSQQVVVGGTGDGVVKAACPRDPFWRGCVPDVDLKKKQKEKLILQILMQIYSCPVFENNYVFTFLCFRKYNHCYFFGAYYNDNCFLCFLLNIIFLVR